MKITEHILIKDGISEQIINTAEQLVQRDGGEKLTVRKVLQAMGGVSNRVFYNRFKNIDEVLNVLYERISTKLRDSITESFDPNGNFVGQVINVVSNTLIMSYDLKMNFNHYIFETDSVSNVNYEWWKAEIGKLIELGKKQGCLGNIDTQKMSYAIWCFIRGYNADALSRGIPRDTAVENFRYAFRILLTGMAPRQS